jgi:hypothetical protein
MTSFVIQDKLNVGISIFMDLFLSVKMKNLVCDCWWEDCFLQVTTFYIQFLGKCH